MNRANLPGWTGRPVRWLIHAVARFSRPLTMGVRAVILDPAGRVLLVRHSYLPGWHFPGGGVEPGETIRAAMMREAQEEASVLVEGEPPLHGVFLNCASRRDHVAVFVVRTFRMAEPFRPDREILEARFFDRAALPDDTTGATRARLREILDGVPLAETW